MNLDEAPQQQQPRRNNNNRNRRNRLQGYDNTNSGGSAPAAAPPAPKSQQQQQQMPSEAIPKQQQQQQERPAPLQSRPNNNNGGGNAAGPWNNNADRVAKQMVQQQQPARSNSYSKEEEDDDYESAAPAPQPQQSKAYGGRGRGGGGRGGRASGQPADTPFGNSRRIQIQRQGRCDAAGTPLQNTLDFSPMHDIPNIRVVVEPFGCEKSPTRISDRDLLLCPSGTVFGTRPGDDKLYERLMAEANAQPSSEELWKLHHGDAHLILNDRHRDDSGKGWTDYAPIFRDVCDRAAKYFNMRVSATRFNFYEDDDHSCKHAHFDAAALKPYMAKKQNTTIAISFQSPGSAVRSAALELDDRQKLGPDGRPAPPLIEVPVPSGSIYCFMGSTNYEWRHAILPLVKQPNGRPTMVTPGKPSDLPAGIKPGRISCILWGWVDQEQFAY